VDVTAKPRPVLREFAALVVATKAGAIGHWGVLRNRCAPGTAGVPPAKGGLEARGPRRSGASAWQLLPSAARYGNYTEKMARDGCGHGGRKRASYKACSYNNHVRRRLVEHGWLALPDGRCRSQQRGARTSRSTNLSIQPICRRIISRAFDGKRPSEN